MAVRAFLLAVAVFAALSCEAAPSSTPTPASSSAGPYACSYYEALTAVADILAREELIDAHRELVEHASPGAEPLPSVTTAMTAALMARDDRGYAAAAQDFIGACQQAGWWSGTFHS